MIDINLIRENPESVKQNIKKRFREEKLIIVDEIRKLDEKWRKSKYEEDSLRSERNKISKEVNEAKKKKDEKKAKELLAKAKKIPEEIEKIQVKRKKMEEEIDYLLKQIPNMLHAGVPKGKDSEDNAELRKWGKIEVCSFQSP